ncbi:hypothetical protein ACFQX7_29595 [Luedemannella flava]
MARPRRLRGIAGQHGRHGPVDERGKREVQPARAVVGEDAAIARHPYLGVRSENLPGGLAELPTHRLGGRPVEQAGRSLAGLLDKRVVRPPPRRQDDAVGATAGRPALCGTGRPGVRGAGRCGVGEDLRGSSGRGCGGLFGRGPRCGQYVSGVVSGGGQQGLNHGRQVGLQGDVRPAQRRHGGGGRGDAHRGVSG